MNVGIGTEAALFPEKEYIMEISFAVPPLHTVYVYTLYLFTEGRGEGAELNQREG